MSLRFLNRPIILRIFLIVVVFLCAIIIGKIISQRYQEQYWKEYERLSKLSPDELIKEMEEKIIYQPCLKVMNELKDENDCELFRKTTDRDSCYFCFAIIKKDKLFCDKISEESSLKKSCEKEFVVIKEKESLVIEETEWKTYSGSGYSIEYPPYFKVIQEYGSFTAFGLDPDLASKAGFKPEERIIISVQVENFIPQEFLEFYQEGSEKEFDEQKEQEYPEIEKINGQIFYKIESWYYYTSLKEVTFKYITKNQKGTRTAIITFKSDGILEDDIPSKLNFKEKVLSSLKF